MERISHSEIEFIRKSLKAGVRQDGREFGQIRQQRVISDDIFQADMSIEIKREKCKICLNFIFRATQLTHEALKLENETKPIFETLSYSLFKNKSLGVFMGHENCNDFLTLKSSFNEPNPCFDKIENWLNSFKLGCQIEIIVIQSDGNIFDLFFEGLRLIFQSIAIPDIYDLSKEIKGNLSLPSSLTFGILGDSYFIDPTGLEEKSADGLIHIFNDEGKKSMLYEGNCQFKTPENIVNSLE